MLASPSKPILAWPTPSPVSVPDIIWGRNYHLGIFRTIFNCNLSFYLRCSLIKDLGSSPFPLSLRCILLAPPANMPIISFHFFDTKYPLFCQLFFLWPCSHYGWTVLIEYQINKKISESSSLSVALSLCSPWRWHTTLLTSDDDAVVISITEISTFVQRQSLQCNDCTLKKQKILSSSGQCQTEHLWLVEKLRERKLP